MFAQHGSTGICVPTRFFLRMIQERDLRNFGSVSTTTVLQIPNVNVYYFSSGYLHSCSKFTSPLLSLKQTVLNYIYTITNLDDKLETCPILLASSRVS